MNLYEYMFACGVTFLFTICDLIKLKKWEKNVNFYVTENLKKKKKVHVICLQLYDYSFIQKEKNQNQIIQSSNIHFVLFFCMNSIDVFSRSIV